MRLQSLEFIENAGQPQEWSLEGLSLGAKNLIVGKNASGKSRILNVIYGLSRSLAGLQGVSLSGRFTARFQHENKTYLYFLDCKEQQVVSERLIIDDKTFLNRGEGGVGTIYAEKIDEGKNIPFQSPTSDVAAVSRRDAIQHSYLEPLYTWASSLRYYPFGTSLGKDLFAIIVPNGPKVDDRDPNAVVGVFREAKKTFGDQFINSLKNDLAAIDYHIENIDVGSPVSIRIQGLPGDPVSLFVKEKDLPGITDQHSMSQGMFRVVSLLIHINYFQLKKTASTVLVDDIGEGLDFDRSCRLIKLLRAKADDCNLQIILSTNDRFVMNSVPLEEWSFLQRNGNHVSVKNYSNSKEIFEDFKFTGLSNFSFLELDVINDQQVSD